nr:putative reverse transcriptase domain-containing protein [Tanacetum cinerariifolium]
MLDHQDKYMMKDQVHVSKSSAVSDIQALPRRKYYCQIYQVVKHMLRGRLLASFQDLEHEGGVTRSQGGIKDNVSKIKIQDHSMQMISQMNSQEQGSKSKERGVRRFGLKGKLSPRFIGPFEILDRVGEVSYRLALPPQLSHVHNVFHVSLLRGYNYHPYHVIQYPFDKIRENLSFAEEPEAIC